MKKILFFSAIVMIVMIGCKKENFEPKEKISFHVDCVILPMEDKYAIDEYIAKVVVEFPQNEGGDQTFYMPVGSTRSFVGDTASLWLGRDMAVYVIFKVHDKTNPAKSIPTSVSPMPQWAKVENINSIERFEAFVGKP